MRASLEKVEHRSTVFYVQVQCGNQFIKFVVKCYYYFRIRNTVDSRPSLDD